MDVAVQQVPGHTQGLHILVPEGLRAHLAPHALQDHQVILVQAYEIVVQVHARMRIPTLDPPRDLDGEQRWLGSGEVGHEERRRRVLS